jgi:hypothetical protein
VLSYYQYFSGGYRDPDLVKGVFLKQGAGHHVGGAVALTAAVYFWIRSELSLISRSLIAAVIAYVTVLSDSKQVLAVFVVSLGVLLLANLKDIRQFIRVLVLCLGVIGLVVFIGYTVLPAMMAGLDISRVQEGLRIKLGVFPLIAEYYKSPLNWLFGIGPGHSVGRLASIIPDYLEQLKAWEVTVSPLTQAAVDLRESYYLSHATSVWSPFFSWAGHWGDLGILGCLAYVSLWYLVYSTICFDDLSRFYLFNIFILGTVFGWMEEPGYMLFVVTLMGLNWQYHQSYRSS